MQGKLMSEHAKCFSVRRALFPAGYYAANSIYQGYISLYYTWLGFANAQLGVISAATAAAALIFQPLWGMLGDRAGNRRQLLALLTLAAACALPLAAAGRGYAVQIIAAFVFYAFFCALLPLGDTILLQADGARFGAYRLAGGASFAAAGALFGLAANRLNALGAVWCAAALLGLTAASALLLPASPGTQREKRSPFSLLKDKRLSAMLLFLLPLQMTMGYFYTFYAPWFKEIGGSEALLGLGYLLSAASEAPYLLLSARIYRRFGAAKPMCAAAGLLAGRWLLLGLARGPVAALLSQLLHGGGFIVITVSMAYWISDQVPDELRASGQALLNMVTFGVARISGNLLGGALAQALGRGGAFIAAAGVCAVAAALLIAFMLCTRTGRALEGR